MAIRNILAGLGILVATAAVSAPAYAVTQTFTYAIGGSLAGAFGGDTISGTGIGSLTGGEPTGLTFTVSGADPTLSSYLGTYTEVLASGSGSSIIGLKGPEIFTLNLIPGLPGFGNPFVGAGSKTGLYSILGTGGSGFAFGGTSVSVTISAVPLPGAVVLFGSAIAAVGAATRWRRRRKAQAA